MCCVGCVLGICPDRLADAFDADTNSTSSSSSAVGAGIGLMLRPQFKSPESFQQLIDDTRQAGDALVRQIDALPAGDVGGLQLMDDLSDLICRAVDPCECTVLFPL
jgi:hypothetical protein